MMIDLISDKSYTALQALYRKGTLPDDTTSNCINQLEQANLICKKTDGYDPSPFAGSSFIVAMPAPKYDFEITELGRAYVNSRERSDKRYHFNEVRAWITLAIACLGAVLSIIAVIFQHATLPPVG